jgi:hypothetical protein
MLESVIEDNKVNKKMNNENIKSLLNQLKVKAVTPELQALVLNFETFLNLDERKDDPAVQQELEQSREQCLSSIEKVLYSFGLTPEAMHEHFENPSNFSPEEWQKVDEMKEEYLGKKKINKRLKLHTGRM